MSDTLKEIEELIKNEKKYTELLDDLEKKIKKMKEVADKEYPFNFLVPNEVETKFDNRGI